MPSFLPLWGLLLLVTSAGADAGCCAYPDGKAGARGCCERVGAVVKDPTKCGGYIECHQVPPNGTCSLSVLECPGSSRFEDGVCSSTPCNREVHALNTPGAPETPKKSTESPSSMLLIIVLICCCFCGVASGMFFTYRRNRAKALEEEGNEHAPVVRLGRKIGQGTFGTVQKVMMDVGDKKGQTVAVKKIPSSDAREVDLMRALLPHPNIVKLLWAEAVGEALHIFMEFLPGGSIIETARQFGGLSGDTIQHYIMQIVEGVRFMHSKNIIHRDIKAANCLVGNDGVVKIADFGCSRRLSDLDVNVAGTSEWMAPEIVTHAEHKYGTTKSDVWAVGCTAIELFTNKTPWGGIQGDFTPVLCYIAEQRSPPTSLPSNLPSEVQSFFDACFQLDPDLRSTAEELSKHTWLVNGVADKEGKLYDVMYTNVGPGHYIPHNKEKAEAQLASARNMATLVVGKEMTNHTVDSFMPPGFDGDTTEMSTFENPTGTA